MLLTTKPWPALVVHLVYSFLPRCFSFSSESSVVWLFCQFLHSFCLFRWSLMYMLVSFSFCHCFSKACLGFWFTNGMMMIYDCLFIYFSSPGEGKGSLDVIHIQGNDWESSTSSSMELISSSLASSPSSLVTLGLVILDCFSWLSNFSPNWTILFSFSPPPGAPKIVSVGSLWL